MSIRSVCTWLAGFMARRHARKHEELQRVVAILTETGNDKMAKRVQAEADIQGAYAARWMGRA